jgi:hypothetical protein
MVSSIFFPRIPEGERPIPTWIVPRRNTFSPYAMPACPHGWSLLFTICLTPAPDHPWSKDIRLGLLSTSRYVLCPPVAILQDYGISPSFRDARIWTPWGQQHLQFGTQSTEPPCSADAALVILTPPPPRVRVQTEFHSSFLKIWQSLLHSVSLVFSADLKSEANIK